MLPGYQFKTFTPLLMVLYFYTSFPSQMFASTGLKIKGGFFNWPTGLGFGLGLVVWGCIYFFVALNIIKWGGHRK